VLEGRDCWLFGGAAGLAGATVGRVGARVGADRPRLCRGIVMIVVRALERENFVVVVWKKFCLVVEVVGCRQSLGGREPSIFLHGHPQSNGN
jgi:hypothetical protein